MSSSTDSAGALAAAVLGGVAAGAVVLAFVLDGRKTALFRMFAIT